MDAEDKKKLDRILQLTEENNKYIKKVRSTQKTAAIIRTIYWLVIIAITLGAYYVVKPFIGNANQFLNEASVNLKQAGLSFPGAAFFEKESQN